MKSFNQFLNESYFSEERPARKARSGSPSYAEVKAAQDAKEAAAAARRAARVPTGAAADTSTQFRPQGTTTNVPGSSVRGPGVSSPSASTPPTGGKPPTSTPPTGGKPPTSPSPTSVASASSATKTATKGVGKGILRGLGRIAGPASAALDVADERSKGSGWARSLAKGAVVAAGGALGGTAGSVAGPVGSVGGAVGGSMAASKAFDVAAGANAKERKGMAIANRQRQAGSAVKGIGGPTSFSQKKPGGPAFMSTGVGKQRKTVQLARTSVVQRGGQSVAGNLAFKAGKAVYKAGPSAKSLAKTSSNPLERIGRSLFAGAYKQSDAFNAAKKLKRASMSDSAVGKKLGVKFKPAG
jgi:hypothetical protein